MPLEIWAFTLTSPPGGRHPAESKIQLIVPGQSRHQRANFESQSNGYRLLIGVHPEENIFVLWDAYKQQDFPWSKNVQIRGPLLWDAALQGIARGHRRLITGLETVLVARGDHLAAAIRERVAAE